MHLTSKDHPQDCDAHRRDAYDPAGEQIGAAWKIIAALMELLPLEQREAIDPDALAVMARVAEVKRRIPRRKAKTKT